MTRELKELPKYTRKEEIVNSLSHLLGLFFGIGTLIFLIVHQFNNNLSFSYMLPFYVYCLCMMVVFFVSAFYHSSPLGSKRRMIARIIDHCDTTIHVRTWKAKFQRIRRT